MLDIALVVALIVMAWVFPAGVRYFIVAPICGVTLGGFTWALAALIGPTSLVNVGTFGCFLACGTVLAEAIAFETDCT